MVLAEGAAQPAEAEPLGTRATAAPVAVASTPYADLDRALAELSENARAFARTPPREKAALLAQTLPLLLEAARDQVGAACAAKGIDPALPIAGEEWLAGPYATVLNVRLLCEALLDIADLGRPSLHGRSIRQRPDGRVEVRVIPRGGPDALLSAGFSADVLMRDGVTRDDVTAQQAKFYREAEPEGGVSLVLGAGNVASIGPMDALHRLFVHGRVVLLKMSPVNAYLAPFFERAFAPLVERGVLRVVYGEADVGAYLTGHPGISDVHITGSNDTHDRIVWGPPGPERDRRKADGDPVFTRPITSELGNVSPVIVMPFLYDKDELWYQARGLCTQIVNNASFNCNAAKMLVLPAGWAQKDLFLEMLKKALGAVPPRQAYYPGAFERYARLTGERARVVKIGEADAASLPWTLVLGLDPEEAHEPLFSSEPFCGILSQVSVGSNDPVEFLAAATTFCNERLWGTLNCAITTHPLHHDDPTIRAARERAIDELRYGAVTLNHWPALAYGFTVTPWGGHPSGTLANVQSGIGFVHNTLMLEGIEKVVVRGPLRSTPKPPYFYDNKQMHLIGERLTHYAADPSWGKALSIAAAALRG